MNLASEQTSGWFSRKQKPCFYIAYILNSLFKWLRLNLKKCSKIQTKNYNVEVSQRCIFPLCVPLRLFRIDILQRRIKNNRRKWFGKDSLGSNRNLIEMQLKNSPGGSEENHEEPLRTAVSGQRFKSSTSWRQMKEVIYRPDYFERVTVQIAILSYLEVMTSGCGNVGKTCYPIFKIELS
jgi:hypothetical protein